MSLPSSFQEFLMLFSGIMTQPSLVTLSGVLVGWLFARRHTITGMIQAGGQVGTKHHSAFHRLFATARWSLDAVGLAIFRAILPLVGEDTVFLVVDDTLARKRGLKVFGVGMHHDPLLSSRARAIVNWGHSWVTLGVLVSFPFRKDHWFCLPILFRLYRSKQTIAREGGRYLTRPELAVEMVTMLCTAYPTQRFHLIADGTYSGQSVVKALPPTWEFTGRAHLDAQLFDPPPERTAHTRGRPRKKGTRRASPRRMLTQGGQCMTLEVYGRHEKARVAQCTALCGRITPASHRCDPTAHLGAHRTGILLDMPRCHQQRRADLVCSAMGHRSDVPRCQRAPGL